MVSVDDKDRAILNVLLENSKLSYRQISKKLGFSSVTVMNRIKRLEDYGIIKKYSAVLDHDKLGFDIPVLIDVRIAKGKLFKVESKISKHPNVVAVFDNTGHFDATVIARFKNRRSMDTFIKQIQTYEDVERTETKLILNTVKEDNLRL